MKPKPRPEAAVGVHRSAEQEIWKIRPQGDTFPRSVVLIGARIPITSEVPSRNTDLNSALFEFEGAWKSHLVSEGDLDVVAMVSNDQWFSARPRGCKNIGHSSNATS